MSLKYKFFIIKVSNQRFLFINEDSYKEVVTNKMDQNKLYVKMV